MTHYRYPKQRAPVSMSIRLSQAIYDALAEAARREDRSLASMARRIIAERLGVENTVGDRHG